MRIHPSDLKSEPAVWQLIVLAALVLAMFFFKLDRQGSGDKGSISARKVFLRQMEEKR